MQVPAVLYGNIKEVRKTCKEALRQWLLGTPYIEAMEAGGMYDAAQLPTQISLHLRGAWSTGAYPTMPADLLVGEQGIIRPRRGFLNEDDPRLAAFVEASLTRPWSLLSLLTIDDGNVFFGYGRHLDRIRRYIAALQRDCAELEAIGPRYGNSIDEPRTLAQGARTVYRGLAALSYRLDDLNNLIGHPFPYVLEPSLTLCEVFAALGVTVDPMWTPPRLPDHPHVLPPPPPLPPSGTFDWSAYMVSPAMEQALATHDQVTIKQLVAEGEPVGRYSDEWGSPLQWAVRHGYTDLVVFLLDHGARVEEGDEEGNTPLMHAAFLGHHEIVHLLLDRGAKVRYRTRKNFDARDFAQMGGHADIDALLKERWRGKKKAPP